MRVEEEVVRGYRTCARDRVADGPCQGYDSEQVDLIRETITITFGDMSGDTSDPYFPIPSHAHERLRPAHERDSRCAHCGGPVSLSLEPRPSYRRLSEHSPDELVRRAQVERDRDQRAAEALTAGERQAIALEKLAASTTGSSEVRELRAELEQVRALLANGNGHAEAEVASPAEAEPPPIADPPAPRRKAT